MYTVAKAPSRLASKASRRGPAQQITLDSFDTGKREQLGSWEMSSPKPVFNGKKQYIRSNSGNNPAANGMSIGNMTHEGGVPQQHEENVRYIAEAWQRVNNELERSKKNGRDDGPEIYREKQANTLQGFEPIDLEQWWGNRTMEKLKIPS